MTYVATLWHVFLLVMRRLADNAIMKRFNSPPNWPAPPEGWVPPQDWQPDPSWPPAPADWVWWVEDASATTPPSAKKLPTHRKDDSSMKNSSTLRSDIQAAANRMASTFGAKRELNRLESELWDGETVSLITSGSYAGGVGLLVLTDRRLLFVAHGITGSKNEDFPLDKITSISFTTGMLLGSIDIHAGGNKSTITNISKSEGKDFVGTARASIGNLNQAPAHASAPAAAPAKSVAEQLQELKGLLDAGILTQEQFDAKAAPLIAQL